MKKHLITLPMLFLAAGLSAQDEQVEMADKMMQDGRIYVVVGVLLIILIGLFLYLIKIDRQVGKLEKKFENQFIVRY